MEGSSIGIFNIDVQCVVDVRLQHRFRQPQDIAYLSFVWQGGELGVWPGTQAW